VSLTRKQRVLKFGGGKSSGERQARSRSTGKWTPDQQGSLQLPRYTGSQVTDSESHYWPPQGASNGDVGGDFYTRKMSGSIPTGGYYSTVYSDPIATGTVDLRRLNTRFQLACPVTTLGNGTVSWPGAQESSKGTLNALGATAIKRCSPVASHVELSTAMGELRKDGLPAVVGSRTWRERTLRAKNAGDEFLNVEFGWLPLVGDVKDILHSIKHSDQLLNQYDSDRGKVVRRRYRFPDEKSETEVTLSSSKMPEGIPISVGFGPASSPGVWSVKTSTIKRRWFSGAFRYGVPTSGLAARKGIATLAQKADYLYGLSFTPDVLWNLTPWTWATDWALNTGDVLANISDFAQHGLIMQYGYLMETTITKVTYSLSGVILYGTPVKVPNASLEIVTKSRTGANPFGFGVTWDGLSSTQAAIAVALGLSRS